MNQSTKSMLYLRTQGMLSAETCVRYLLVRNVCRSPQLKNKMECRSFLVELLPNLLVIARECYDSVQW